jgi:hypothetical protein
MVLPLMVGTGVLLGGLLLWGMATDVIVGLIARLLRDGRREPGFWRSAAVMMTVTLITFVGHLGPITLWAVAFVACGEIASFENAWYFSVENYTALGYGDIVLSERWRLLGPLEAMNGLLMFGVSTGLMFAILSRLISRRLRFESARLKQRGPDSSGLLGTAGGEPE